MRYNSAFTKLKYLPIADALYNRTGPFTATEFIHQCKQTEGMKNYIPLTNKVYRVLQTCGYNEIERRKVRNNPLSGSYEVVVFGKRE